MSTLAVRLQTFLGTNYRLDRELLGGGMSRVFLADEITLGRRVVIKVLSPELSAGVNRDRFRREIQLAAQLQHPHIVPVLTAGEQEDLLWYTMPFIEGESLRIALDRKQVFSVRDVKRILHDVLDGLVYAHSRGVVHRDIKPANILMHGSHALVIDFGVAKALTAALPDSGLTTAGMAIGTPAYMAPEQLAGDPTLDARVDIYAAGLLAYELLAGKSPFSGTTPRELMTAQLTTDPPPLKLVRDDVPPSLAMLISRMLAKDPDARPASAADVLQSLDDATEVITQVVPVPNTAPRNRMLVLSAALVGAVVLAATVLGRGGNTDKLTRADSVTAAVPPAPVESAHQMSVDSVELKELVEQMVAARMAALTPSRAVDSTKQRAIADSMAKALIDSVAPATQRGQRFQIAPRRIVISSQFGRGGGQRGRAQVVQFANIAVDSLQRRISRLSQYRVVPLDSVLQGGNLSRSDLRQSDVGIVVFLYLNKDSAGFKLRFIEPGPDSMPIRPIRGVNNVPIVVDGPVVLRPAVLSTLPQVVNAAVFKLGELRRFGRGGGRAGPAGPLPPRDSARGRGRGGG